MISESRGLWPSAWRSDWIASPVASSSISQPARSLSASTWLGSSSSTSSTRARAPTGLPVAIIILARATRTASSRPSGASPGSVSSRIASISAIASSRRPASKSIAARIERNSAGSDAPSSTMRSSSSRAASGERSSERNCTSVTRAPGSGSSGSIRPRRKASASSSSTLRDEPLDQRPARRLVLGEALDHLAQLRPDLVVAAELAQEPQPRAVERGVVGSGGDAGIDDRERPLPVARAQQVVEHDATRGRGGGIGVEQGAGVGDRGSLRRLVLGQRGVAVGEARQHRAHARVVGRDLGGGPRVALDRLPVAGVERELRERAPSLQILGILLDQPQVLAKGLARVAALAQDLGVGGARVAVHPVELEDVAELDHRAIDVARPQMLQRRLVMALGALLGRLARRQQRRGAQQRGADPRVRGARGGPEDGTGRVGTGHLERARSVSGPDSWRDGARRPACGSAA